MLEGAMTLPSGVAAKLVVGSTGVQFSAAIISDDGQLLAAACVGLRQDGPEVVQIF